MMMDDGQGKPRPRVDFSTVFRVTNFELFVKPNKYVMGAGLAAFSLCIIYMVQWNRRVRLESMATNGSYVALNEDGQTETLLPRRSKWD